MHLVQVLMLGDELSDLVTNTGGAPLGCGRSNLQGFNLPPQSPLGTDCCYRPPLSVLLTPRGQGLFGDGIKNCPVMISCAPYLSGMPSPLG